MTQTEDRDLHVNTYTTSNDHDKIHQHIYTCRECKQQTAVNWPYPSKYAQVIIDKAKDKLLKGL